MQLPGSGSKKIWRQIILACALLSIILYSFYIFTQSNHQRIVQQNEDYIEDVTKQTSDRIDDMLLTRQNALNVMAVTVESVINTPYVSQDMLEMLQEKSVFDYLEFVDSEGINHRADGRTSNSSDRTNYIEGMKGKEGVALIFNSRITHETLVNYYTPISYDGKIIGVLNGMYREQRLREILSTDFFGVHTDTYLCTKDGVVISSSCTAQVPKNILKSISANSGISAEDASHIQDAFETHHSYGYTYQDSDGTCNAYLTALTSTDWMLLQTFPSVLTNTMLRNANSSGVELEIRLVILFVLYMIYLLLENSIQKKRLLNEKQKLSWIIEAILPLFSRFVIVDYEKGTYEYLEGTQKGIPAKGSYDDLLSYMAAHYINETDMEVTAALISKESVQGRLLSGKPYLQYEYRINWGEERWENASILRLKEKDGVPVSVLFAIQDVTGIKEWEQKTRQSLEDAFQAAEDANHAKSQFLSRMSHDIRTPMNAIMGMTSIALMHLDDPSRVADCLGKIQSSSRHLLDLINEVLDMSKIESGKIVLAEEPFCLPDIVENIVSIISPQVETKKQHLVVNISGIPHKNVIGDPLRLRQMLVNIVANAAKFTPEGGTISFGLSEKPSKIQGSACYEFTVEDNGIGMEEEFIAQIFTPFSRSKNSSVKNIEGTGLGMSIAQNIAQVMNGTIDVKSHLNEGTLFTVRVYLKLQQTEDHDVVKPQEHISSCLDQLTKSSYDGIRILLAEDNLMNMEIARELLSSIGIQTESAWDGQEAIDAVLAHPPYYYQLIFMDIQMPKKDGYEAAREIRSIDRDDLKKIPIVAMSADAFADDVRRALDAGMNDHVAKPVEIEKLLNALKKWL